MKSFKKFKEEQQQEDAPVNNVGGGNIHGVGVGPSGEPGIKKKKKKDDDIVLGSIKRKIQEHDDNNNVLLRDVLRTLDVVEMASLNTNTVTTELTVTPYEDKETVLEKAKLKEYGFTDFTPGLGGHSLGSLDAFKPMSDLGDGPPRNQGHGDKRGTQARFGNNKDPKKKGNVVVVPQTDKKLSKNKE